LKNRRLSYLNRLIEERDLKPESDIIVTHSAWSFQSGWGNFLAKRGFTWIFMPHGSFVPWALSHKWLKKRVYLKLVEMPRLLRVNAIRSISTPERENLIKLFPEKEIALIPNGFEPINDIEWENKPDKRIFLFMARLHHKKGVLPLVKAWLRSPLQNNPKYQLVIAGPDEDELKKIKPLLAQSDNAIYVGPIYNPVKEDWLNKSTFYILPSKAEGFAMSVLEAANRGGIPVISEGCNFPEIFHNNLAVKTGLSENEIIKSLIQCSIMDDDKIDAMSREVKCFIENNYSTDIIAEKLYKLYSRVLKN